MVTNNLKCYKIIQQLLTNVSTTFPDIPMSVGIVDPRANPTQLNTVEFLWDPSKRTSVFIQVWGQSTIVRERYGEIQALYLSQRKLRIK